MLSTTLHAGVAALLVALGYLLVKPAAPQEILQLVGAARLDSVREPAHAGMADDSTRVRFVAPARPRISNAPQHEIPAEAPVEASRKPAANPPRRTVTESEFRERQGARAVSAPAQPARTRPTAAPPIDTREIVGDLVREARRASGSAPSFGQSADALRYLALLERALAARLEEIPGFDEQLIATVEYRIREDGRLETAGIIAPSSDSRFDAAIVQVINRFVAAPRPRDVSERHRTTFRTRAR